MTRAVFLGSSSSFDGHGVTTGAAARRFVRPAWFLLGLLLLGACGTPGERSRYEYERPEMGTVFRVVLYAESEREGRAAAEAAFDRIEELNRTLSDYDPESELSRLSKTAGTGQELPVSDDLWTMLEASRMTSMYSDGAFDSTVGPVVKLWRRARRQRELPPAEEIAEAMKAVGYEKVLLDPLHRTAELTAAGMRLDLGGIAKGYACDEALKVLRRRGMGRAMVVGGGDVVAGDPPPGKLGWTVAMMPLGDSEREARDAQRRYILLSNGAVSTSGDAFQHVEIGGKRYSHIVDPRTGIGLTTPMGVTVVARDGTTADAYATALNVLGPGHGMRLIETIPDAAAIMVLVNEEGRAVTLESSRVSELVFVRPRSSQ